MRSAPIWPLTRSWKAAAGAKACAPWMASRQYELLLQLENALAFLSRWTLERGQRFMPDPGLVRDWQAYWRQYLDHLGHGGELHALVSAAPVVSRQVLSDRLRDFPVLVDLSRHSHETLKTVAALADAVMELCGLRQIIALFAEVKARDQWEYRLQIILEGRLRAAVARLCGMMLRTGIREPAAFFRQHGMQQFLAKFQRLRLELHETLPVALTPFAALGGELDALTDACGAASGYS